MKKLLAIVLATLMLAGVFAVGTSAFFEPPFPDEALNAAWARFEELFYFLLEAVETGDISEADAMAIDDVMVEYIDYVALFAMISAENWAAATALLEGWIAQLEALMIEHGLLEPPTPPPWHETLPAFVQWIFRWIFFGWIWM